MVNIFQPAMLVYRSVFETHTQQILIQRRCQSPAVGGISDGSASESDFAVVAALEISVGFSGTFKDMGIP